MKAQEVTVVLRGLGKEKFDQPIARKVLVPVADQDTVESWLKLFESKWPAKAVAKPALPTVIRAGLIVTVRQQVVNHIMTEYRREHPGSRRTNRAKTLVEL